VAQLDEVVRKLVSTPKNNEAWEELFCLTWPYVLALAHRHLSGPRRASDAEDLAQEVFLKLARVWHAGQVKARDGNALLAILAVTTRQLSIDRARHQHRLRRDSSKEVSTQSVAEPADIFDGPSEAEWSDLLRVVSCELSADERQILDMRLQGYELAEIAGRLGVGTRTTERKLFRIKQFLRTHFIVEN
jgi:RNA polymerase sigma factor (sigma-70 family)